MRLLESLFGVEELLKISSQSLGAYAHAYKFHGPSHHFARNNPKKNSERKP